MGKTETPCREIGFNCICATYGFQKIYEKMQKTDAEQDIFCDIEGQNVKSGI